MILCVGLGKFGFNNSSRFSKHLFVNVWLDLVVDLHLDFDLDLDLESDVVVELDMDVN